jgi:hypothetical protein
MTKKKFFAFSAMLILLIAGGWFGARVLMQPAPAPMATLDYTDYSNWAVFPHEAPAPVWRDGWVADVFMIAPGARIKNTHRLDTQDLARARKKTVDNIQGLLPNLAGIGTVYAPLLRAEAVDIDIEAALSIYLNGFNKGRALVIVTDREINADALLPISSNPAVRERFAGFLILSPEGNDNQTAIIQSTGENAAGDAQLCPPQRISDEEAKPPLCESVLNIERVSGTYTFVDHPITDVSILDGWMDYLRKNVSPLAEPLGGFEEVEIIDVRRPGETTKEN